VKCVIFDIEKDKKTAKLIIVKELAKDK